MSTIEYTAVVLLASIVLAVTGATVAGVDVADAVGRKLRVALCVVANDDCDENGEEEACVVASSSKDSQSSLSIAVFRAKDGRNVLVEELSNGRYRVTVVQTTGVGGGTGLSAGIKLWKWGADVGIEAEAYATAGYERVFEVDGKAAAERLVERLDDDDWKLAGAAKGAVEMVKGDHAGATEQSFQVGVGAEATAALEALGFEPAAAALAGSYTAGLKLNHRTGERSISLSQEIGGSADVNLQLAILGIGGKSPRSLTLKFDRQNRPKALVLRTGIVGEARAEVGGMAPVGSAAGGAAPGSLTAGLNLAAGARAEVEAELDLTDPALKPHVDRLLRGDVSAVAPMVGAMATGARIKAQAYATTEETDGWGFSGKVPIAGEIGIDNEKAERTTKLLSAFEHKPGTPLTAWERDCVATA